MHFGRLLNGVVAYTAFHYFAHMASKRMCEYPSQSSYCSFDTSTKYLINQLVGFIGMLAMDYLYRRDRKMGMIATGVLAAVTVAHMYQHWNSYCGDAAGLFGNMSVCSAQRRAFLYAVLHPVIYAVILMVIIVLVKRF